MKSLFFTAPTISIIFEHEAKFILLTNVEYLLLTSKYEPGCTRPDPYRYIYLCA